MQKASVSAVACTTAEPGGEPGGIQRKNEPELEGNTCVNPGKGTPFNNKLPERVKGAVPVKLAFTKRQSPAHTSGAATLKLTVGAGCRVIAICAEAVQPAAFDTVTE